jgi:hypothetical protein
MDDYIKKCEDSYSDNPTLEANEMEKWMDGCTFQCKECPLSAGQFSAKAELVLHLKYVHGIDSIKKYSAKHGSLVLHARKYCCRICNKLILWSRGAIIGHLYKSHQMTAGQEWIL